MITYARAIGHTDWDLLESCLTETVYVDFSEAGMPANDLARTDFVAFAHSGLSKFTASQHLSPNHLIEFDAADSDRAICCYSYMCAQQQMAGSKSGEFYLMRGYYTNRMVRTSAGEQIEHLTQHISWLNGKLNAPVEVFGRLHAAW